MLDESNHDFTPICLARLQDPEPLLILSPWGTWWLLPRLFNHLDDLRIRTNRNQLKPYLISKSPDFWNIPSWKMLSIYQQPLFHILHNYKKEKNSSKNFLALINFIFKKLFLIIFLHTPRANWFFFPWEFYSFALQESVDGIKQFYRYKQ